MPENVKIDETVTEEIKPEEPVEPRVSMKDLAAKLDELTRLLGDIKANTTRPAREPMPEKVEDAPRRPTIYDM